MPMESKLTDMDVDGPSQNSATNSSLKRCSSAPMINEINVKMNTSPSPSPSSRESLPFNIYAPRVRRFSASFSPIAGTGSFNTGPRLTPRVNQLRQEESVDVSNVREVAHEREIHSAMQMSQSWEDLTLFTDNLSCKSDSEIKQPKDVNKMGPLNISLPNSSPSCSSPSPTRTPHVRPCLSPSLSIARIPTMSPSPTRKCFKTRRSLSPIAIRPSPLGPVKRKFEIDDEKSDQYLTPSAKRLNSFHPVERGGLLITQNSTSSPLPGSLSSVGTPESLSSVDSPGFFHSVDSPSPNRLIGSGDEPMNDERIISQLPSSKHSNNVTSVNEN